MGFFAFAVHSHVPNPHFLVFMTFPAAKRFHTFLVNTYKASQREERRKTREERRQKQAPAAPEGVMRANGTVEEAKIKIIKKKEKKKS